MSRDIYFQASAAVLDIYWPAINSHDAKYKSKFKFDWCLSKDPSRVSPTCQSNVSWHIHNRDI